MTDDEQAISEYQALNLTQFDILDRFDLSQHYRSDRQHELVARTLATHVRERE